MGFNKEYKLAGGQPVTVTPLEVNEEGTYEAPLGKAYNPVKVTGAGGGSGIFWVTLTYDDVGDTYTANKSYSDIAGAVASGLLPVFIEAFGDGGAIHQLYSYANASPDTYTVILVGALEATASTATENLVFSSGK